MCASEKENYLLQYLDFCIEKNVYEILADSVEDPQFSAVTANNLIKCYLDVTGAENGDVGASGVEAYLADRCFTPEEIKIFQHKVKEESKYYIGKQY